MRVFSMAAEIRLRVERRAGEMLAAMEKAKNGKSTTTSLVAPGITHNQSSRWQTEAKLDEDEFDEIVRECH
jgi:hypothetical protein